MQFNHLTSDLKLKYIHICYKGLSIIPSILLGQQQDWKNNVREFCESYNQDITNMAGLDAELILWGEIVE